MRDTQFKEEVNARLAAAEKEKAAALELIETKIKAYFQQQLANKQQEINELQYKSKSQLVSEVSKKEEIGLLILGVITAITMGLAFLFFE